MNRVGVEEITVSIITRLFERYDKRKFDDVEFIPIIKYVIQGALDTAEENEFPGSQIDVLHESLLQYAQQLYIQCWLMQAEEGEDKELEAVDGSNWFQYIYEHEEYPR
jgi:hypothetical protein